MKNKTLKIVFGMLLLFIGIVAAYTLPDIEPIISFSSNTQQANITAVLTTVAVDSLENAGIDKIELYQDNQLLDSKDCDSSTCTFIKTIVSTTPASHSYYAKAEDFGGHVVNSETITITFNGLDIDYPLVIDLPDNTSFDEDTSAILDLSNYIVDLDNSLSELTFTFSGNTNIQVSITNGIATLTPAANWNGQETITLKQLHLL